MRGNSLISPEIPPRDALIIVRGMLGGPDTAIRGVVDGLKCLKNFVKQRNHDVHTISLLELVTMEANSLVKSAISRGAFNERVSWIA